MIADVVGGLRSEAMATGERRGLVLAGDHEAGIAVAERVLGGLGTDGTAVAIGRSPIEGAELVAPERAGELLGTNHAVVIVDAHAGLRPNVIGRVVGTVDGGGLFVLLTPSLDTWSSRSDPFDETLVVPPFDRSGVSAHFRRRFVRTLREHPGIAIVDLDAGRVVDDGLTDPAPRLGQEDVAGQAAGTFPAAAYEACLTADQGRALRALEALTRDGTAVVVEADRGRGKSSVGGLAAGALALAGERVCITAPRFGNAEPAFERAAELVAEVEGPKGAHAPTPPIETNSGGRIAFAGPTRSLEADPDVLLVDEAAAIPVPILASLLDVGRVAFTTTVHGYEGAGRGFSVRFRDRLESSDLDVTDVSLTMPIRYAAGDPVEIWSFRALLLDAAPAPAQVFDGVEPGAVDYRRIDAETVIEDEPRLRELFGLLVLAHYRTEPDDLARLLDAPNVSVRALLYDDHVVSVALLAREGGLAPSTRTAMYEGGRVRGNMLPDVLTSQLRDESAGKPVGVRIMRIATHHAARSSGLGSRLLEEIEAEYDDLDWIGTGYGATPELVRFWTRNGYRTVHCSTTQNAASGEHSAIMLKPTSDAGRELFERHASQFLERFPGVLSDALSTLDPDVARAVLRSSGGAREIALSEPAWRHVASTAYGPGLLDVDPAPFRTLVAGSLTDPSGEGRLSTAQERLLVARVLQGRSWSETAETLGYETRTRCMRALGEALKPLVDGYGSAAALEERDRYVD